MKNHNQPPLPQMLRDAGFVEVVAEDRTDQVPSNAESTLSR